MIVLPATGYNGRMSEPLSPLLLDPGVVRTIAGECLRTYPLEACGVLLGSDLPAGRLIREAMAVPNIAPGPQAKRFVMDPRGLLEAERAAAAAGLEILGIFHSHPDCPAQPSATDLAAAWEVYSYLIVSVSAGRVNEMRSFQLRAGVFVEEPIRGK
jgi:proteasome lid subunit RPN8/RPN11